MQQLFWSIFDSKICRETSKLLSDRKQLKRNKRTIGNSTERIKNQVSHSIFLLFEIMSQWLSGRKLILKHKGDKFDSRQGPLEVDCDFFGFTENNKEREREHLL